MGCTIECANSKKKDDTAELKLNNNNSGSLSDSLKPPTITYIGPANVENNLNNGGTSNSFRLSPSSSMVKQGSFSLSLNKSKFVNEKKSKITDYYTLKDVIGEG